MSHNPSSPDKRFTSTIGNSQMGTGSQNTVYNPYAPSNGNDNTTLNMRISHLENQILESRQLETNLKRRIHDV
mgnify:CR=1 FL=1